MTTIVDRPLISPMFGDHMVLQRDRPNPIWGWTEPDAKVSVNLAGTTAYTVADASGKWMIEMVPPKVGGPYKLKVQGATSIELSDILVGDVWICGGQSNMEMGLLSALDGVAEAGKADDPQIRLFMAPRQVAYEPKEINGGKWKVCSPKAVSEDGWGGFSAVGYYFGKKLQKDLNIPVGLVQAAWGGTSAEAWTSAAAIKRIEDFDADLVNIESLRSKGATPVGTYLELWLAEHDATANAEVRPQYPQFDDSKWKTVRVPDGFSDLDEKDSPGAAWFRKEVELPDPLPAGTAMLHLGKIKNVDWTWVNGKVLGYNGSDDARTYWMWPGSIQPGKNILTVKVFNPRGKSGFISTDEDLYIELGDKKRISLAGEWKADLLVAIKPDTAMPRNLEVNPTVPTTLANGMIAPIAPLAVKGAIWYQGETNAGRGYQYRKILPALIADWRRMFKNPEMPFYIVSITPFGDPNLEVGDDYWAELREAQAMTATAVPHSGLVVTLDAGDPHDIHPKNKRTVGERLALLALAGAYGTGVVANGPIYESMKVEGKSIRIMFKNSHHQLVLKEGTKSEFAVAASDRKWVPATAKVDGETLIVSAESVPNPVAVRYAWRMAPSATLFNGSGLPAAPFRTDTWPELSRNSK